jgi:phosphohistidine swiveling domain-containing protein
VTTETQQEHAMPGPSEPIPTPPDFPVRWEQPGEEQLFWQQDRMHFPDPFVPLAESLFIGIIYEHCFNYAGDRLDFPIRFRPQTQNGYMYQTILPKAASPEEMEELGRKAQETLMAGMPTLRARFKDEFLPEVEEHIAAIQAMDLDSPMPEQLRTYVDEAVQRARRLWEIHFLLALPAMPPISIFEDMYRDLFGAESGLAAYTLLQGEHTLITETGLALWRLSRQALQIPEVRRVLEEEASADVIPALEQTEEGRAFLADLRAYLETYGKRSSSALVFDEVTWLEDPTPVITMLKDYVGQPDRDLEAEQEEQRAERERAIADAREQLSTYPEQVRGQFEFLLDAALQGIYVAEEHNFYIDYNAMYEVRRVFNAVGRAFAAASRLDDPQQVYYLTLDEVRQGLEESGMELRPIVAQRMAEHTRRLVLHAPPVIGSMPPGPPPNDPLSATFIKFFGGEPSISSDPAVVQGTPGAQGVARGTARILHGIRDADRLQSGDIIVAEATATPWTPFFAVAAGIVTDSGGVLSHAAVAAREYGIPAVVGAAVATAKIRDGQLIEIDGNTGLVRLLENA